MHPEEVHMLERRWRHWHRVQQHWCEDLRVLRKRVSLGRQNVRTQQMYMLAWRWRQRHRLHQHHSGWWPRHRPVDARTAEMLELQCSVFQESVGLPVLYEL
jgi:hypothetical protein